MCYSNALQLIHYSAAMHKKDTQHQLLKQCVQLTVTSKDKWLGDKIAGNDEFHRKFVVWDVSCTRTDHYTGVHFSVIYPVLGLDSTRHTYNRQSQS